MSQNDLLLDLERVRTSLGVRWHRLVIRDGMRHARWPVHEGRVNELLQARAEDFPSLLRAILEEEKLKPA